MAIKTLEMQICGNEVDEEIAEKSTYQADEGRQRNDRADDAKEECHHHEARVENCKFFSGDVSEEQFQYPGPSNFHHYGKSTDYAQEVGDLHKQHGPITQIAVHKGVLARLGSNSNSSQHCYYLISGKT